MPTNNIVTQKTVMAIHGPLAPNDEGVKAFWEALIAKLQSEKASAWRVLKWLGFPRELTVAFYETKPSLSSVVAVNFQKGYRWLWLLLRIFGKHYKGAHYHAFSPELVAGLYGGTIIMTENEVSFCHAIDNLLLADKGKKQALKLTQKLHNQYDFVGFIKPQILPPSERLQLPVNLGEIRLDIVNAKELRGSVLWICQGEREAEAMMKALERVEGEISLDYSRKGVQCSFRKHREGMFVWWEFRLTNFVNLWF